MTKELTESTELLTRANDRLAAHLSGVTDEQRLVVVREIWQEMRKGGGNPHEDLNRYEREVKARLGR